MLRILSILLGVLLLFQPILAQSPKKEPANTKPKQDLVFKEAFTNGFITIYAQKNSKHADGRAKDLKKIYRDEYTESYLGINELALKNLYYKKYKRFIYYKEASDNLFATVEEFQPEGTSRTAKLKGYSVKIVDDLYDVITDETCVKVVSLDKNLVSNPSVTVSSKFNLEELKKALAGKADAREIIDQQLLAFFGARFDNPLVVITSKTDQPPKSQRLNDLTVIHYPYYLMTWDTLYISAKLFEAKINDDPDYQTQYFLLQVIEHAYLFWTFCELYNEQVTVKEYSQFLEDYGRYTETIYDEARERMQTTIIK